MRCDVPQLLWLLIAIILLVDTLSGFFSQQLGLNIRLSQIVKFLIIILCFYSLLCWRSRLTSYLVIGLVFVMAGPLLRLLTQYEPSFFQFDVVFATRILMFFSVLAFCIECARNEPDLFVSWSVRTMQISFWIVALNVVIGLMGFGFPTYKNTGVGFKGFFYAGNEVSAVFVLLSAFMMHKVWNEYSKFAYIAFSLAVLVIGASIATKAGILFSILVVILTPVINLRQYLLSFKSICIFLFLLILFALFLVQTLSYIESLSAFEQLKSNFLTRGVLAFVLSGREEFVKVFFESIQDVRGISVVLFGDGARYFDHMMNKEAAEVDPVDVMMYFGLPVTFFILFLSVFSVYLPLSKLVTHYYSPAIFLANTALLGFAVIAGHVWTSGMLGITWAVFNSMLLLRVNNDQASCSKNGG